MDISERFGYFFPQPSRNCGAKVLEYLWYNPPGLELYNNYEFAKDSLFCEWAYVIDLDNEVLEVYKGFNKTPLTPEDRFYFNGEVETEYRSEDSRYYPVKLFRSFKFKELKSVENFIEMCREPEEDDDSEA